MERDRRINYMAQNVISDLVAAGTSGTELVAWINGLKNNFVTTNAGTGQPAYVQRGTLWANTTGSVYSINLFDGSDSIVFADIDSTRNKARFAVDSDRDTYIVSSSTDDQIEIFASGSKRIIISPTGISVGGNAPRVSLDCTGTDAIKLPAGTTAQRPSSAIAGMVRYNSTTNGFEGYNGTSWGALGGGSGGGTGITTITAATDTDIVSPEEGQVLIYNSNAGRWTNRNVSGDASISEIGVITFNNNSVDTNNLINSSVSTAKINNNAVTEAKIGFAAVNNQHLKGITANGSDGQLVTTNGTGGFSFVTPSFTISDGTVTTAKLADGSVTPEKLKSSNSGSSGQVYSRTSDTQGEWVSHTPLKQKTTNSITNVANASTTFNDNPQMIWIAFDAARCGNVGGSNEGLLIRLNNANTGYTGGSSAEDTRKTATNGFLLTTRSPNHTFYGIMQLQRMSNGVWIASHSGTLTNANPTTNVSGGGRKVLSGNLTSISIYPTSSSVNLTGGTYGITYY